MKSLVKSLLHPLRTAAGRFVIPPEPRHLQFLGDYGCIRCAASHIAWNQVWGDYLEFGVAKGHSFAEAYHALTWWRASQYASSPQSHGNPEYEAWRAAPPRLFAFDSFEGLPAGEMARDADYNPGAFACSEPDFLANITRKGVPRSRVITVPGFYDASLTAAVKAQHRLEKAALVMVDCDLYESTVPVLDFITDLVQQGTIIVFHDWYRYKGSRRHGEQRACREWLERNPAIQLEPWWQETAQAKAFLVHRD